jgi:hypothetical protein
MPGGPFDLRPGSATPASRREALVRFATFALAAALLAELAWMIATIWTQASAASIPTVGYDFSIYVDRTRSWLGGDGFYRARQLMGPYSIEGGDALYPPPAILLFLPWALGAPAFLWWAIPFLVGAVSLWRMRPPLWAWVVLLAVVTLYPRTFVAIVLGNPSMWAFAAVLAGAAFGWPAVAALVKPALAPFALIGASRRSWWIALAIVGLLAVAFAPMWPDYLHVLEDARYSGSIDYVIGEIPIAAALAIVGWVANRRAVLHRERASALPAWTSAFAARASDRHR